MASSPRGLTAFGVFLCFGAVMSALAGITLIWPGTRLDQAWRLNPEAHAYLSSFGANAGVAFALLSGLMAFAALGWFRRRWWAWQLALGLISAEVVGGVVNAIRGELLKGTVGMLAAGALLYYLSRPPVRSAFRRVAS